ncbi:MULTISPECIES: hypothetical protein [unclassified Mesorhizobium]|uniref:hypothetical protein n=1 Tax=unclassified Mesorhizobium TaxID=325217 RepID=UPI000FCA28F6|nr:MULTISPECIES: hypothetical protein [unclassified Mesorhizobium]RUX97157.1 hypothetical protein EN993_05005 [Mesorhizobium sp. M7D.F.Ca.US.004.01.2.1]RVA28287.1 hypothetical protein EN935_18845 [Mesorhizobium sp. M7D.F.Ca.US.004.03.1.1]
MTGAAEPEIPVKLAEAAKWLAETPRAGRGSAVPEMQQRFGLSVAEACEVCRLNNLRLARAT